MDPHKPALRPATELQHAADGGSKKIFQQQDGSSDKHAARLGTVVITAAGTGGHITPGLAVAEELRKQGVKVIWLGGKRPLEYDMVSAAGFEFHALPMMGLRGRGLHGVMQLPWRLCRASVHAWRLLRRLKPQVVLAFGGYVTGPVGLVAYMCRTPLFIHEQNAVAGMTNRYLSRLSKGVFTAFPHAFPVALQARLQPRIQVIGNPLRLDQAIVSQSRDRHATLTQKKSHRREHPLRILVLGGSQGAAFLNQHLPEVFTEFASNKPIAVRHQAGQRALSSVQQHYAEHKLWSTPNCSVEVVGFIPDLAASYAWADVIICRAGALTVSEVAAAGVPAIFIPFPAAVDDHQWHNASYLVDQGAAYVVREQDFSSAVIQRYLKQWHEQPQSLLQMAQAARAAAKLDAATELVSQVQAAMPETVKVT